MLTYQLMVILLKLADISNEARPTVVADMWLECLLEEYFKQVTTYRLELYGLHDAVDNIVYASA